MSHENDGNDREDSRGVHAAFFMGLCAGAVIGSGLALLFAPRAGSELRGQMASSAANISKAVSKTIDGASVRGREVYDSARDVVSRAGDGIDRLVTNMTKSLDKGLTVVGEMAGGSTRADQATRRF